MDDNSTPTDEGLVRVVWRVRCMPPAGSFAGKSKLSTFTRFLNPFIPSSTTCASSIKKAAYEMPSPRRTFFEIETPVTVMPSAVTSKS